MGIVNSSLHLQKVVRKMQMIISSVLIRPKFTGICFAQWEISLLTD